MNKVDLVPTWVTVSILLTVAIYINLICKYRPSQLNYFLVQRKWLATLSKELPTVVFHASMQHSFGKGALINLLRQFSKLHKEKPQVGGEEIV